MTLPVIVLDVDDTLYLEVDFVKSGFRAVERWLEAEHGIAGLFDVAWNLFQTADRTRVFNLALDRLCPDAAPDLAKRLVVVYRSHRPDIALAPDARRLLETFRGERLAALTDGFALTQLQKVRALDLEHHCDPVVRTGVWGKDFWKPHQRGYRFIQDHFGVSGSDCLYIGDNPKKDFIGARALGWRTIRIRRPGGLHAASEAESGFEADCTIADLDAIIARPALLEPAPTIAVSAVSG